MSKNSAMVCVPIMAESVKQVVSEMHQAKEQGADVVEIWLDSVKTLRPFQDLEFILGNKPLPVIVVFRPKCGGGQNENDENFHFKTLQLATEMGADYIDLDFKMPSDLIQKLKKSCCNDSKVIVSCYLSNMTPSTEVLHHHIEQMLATSADIIKIVTNATDITEVEKIFGLLAHAKVPLIAYSEGERGFISQVLSPKYGGLLVYGSLEGNQVAGLPTLASLREVYKIDCINAETKVFGLVSKPVGHSKGPILHNPTFKHINYNAVYVPMFVDDLKQFFRVYASCDFAGFSVGIPYKEAAVQFCHEIDPLAESIGAINTIIRRSDDGKLIGYNTDCEASITAIEDALKEHGCTGQNGSALARKLFVLVGAGGAGRALAFGAKSRGARIVVFDIDFERARSLANAVLGEVRPFEDLVNFWPEKGAILANATPLGMHPNTDRIPVPEESLGDYLLVFDSVYTPRKTRLLREAEAAGAIIVSGVEMFLGQAVGQFKLFTSRSVPEAFMRDIVLSQF